MENWAKAVGMQGYLRRKILHAKEMYKRLESLPFLDASMIRTLSVSDFRLTYATMRRLLSQASSTSTSHGAISDESKNSSRQEKSLSFGSLLEDGTFFEAYSAGVHPHAGFQLWHISDLTLPLTEEMAKHLAEPDCFNFYSSDIELVSSETRGNFLRHLMAAIPVDKRLIIRCRIQHYGCGLQALMRHLHHYQLQSATSQIHPNIEVHPDYYSRF